MTLSFEPGMTERYTSLRESIAVGIYRRGLGNTAIDLDIAPSNLSVQLSDDPHRHFSVDSLERYIAKTGDTTPIYYLIEKFLSERAKDSEAEMAAAMQALKQMAPAFKRLGLI